MTHPPERESAAWPNTETDPRPAILPARRAQGFTEFASDTRIFDVMDERSRWAGTFGATPLAEKGGYLGRLRRGARATQRSARALATPQLYPNAVVVPTFWWEVVKNFGDLLTPYLLPEWNVVPILTPADQAALVGVGSLIQHLPDNFEGVLWGTGLIEDRQVDLPGATALALRGDLTRDRLGSPAVLALGDPGLLLQRRIRRQTVRWDVGVIPHFSHQSSPELQRLVEGFAGSVTVIDVQRHPAIVGRRIAACRAIVTTSLHGLIIADSLGIPAVWVVMPNELYGGDFKFHDHETIAAPARTRRRRVEDIESLRDAVAAATPADEDRIGRACDGLIRAARRIPEVVRHERLTPPKVPARVFAAAFPGGH